MSLINTTTAALRLKQQTVEEVLCTLEAEADRAEATGTDTQPGWDARYRKLNQEWYAIEEEWARRAELAQRVSDGPLEEDQCRCDSCVNATLP